MGAIGRWVRQPDSLLDRKTPKYWKLLLEDLHETVRANAGQDLESALVNIIIPTVDDKELVQKVGCEIFKNLQVINNQAKVLASSEQLKQSSDTSICHIHQKQIFFLSTTVKRSV